MAIGKRWVAIIMTIAIHHAIVTILSRVTIHSTGGVAIGVGGGGVVGPHGTGITVLYPRHPGGVIVVDSLGVVLLSPCPGLASVHVVPVHVVGLRHTRGLAVGATEWFWLGRRHGFVDASLGRRQWLVV